MGIVPLHRAGRGMCVVLLALTFNACDADTGRAAGPPPNGGIVVVTAGAEDTSTGPEMTTGESDTAFGSSGDTTSTTSEGTSTGFGSGSTTTSTGDTSTGQGEGETTTDPSTGADVSTSSSSSSTDTTTTGSTSDTSTGDEPPAPSVCGDGVCDEAELAVECFMPGWCYGDCVKTPTCLSDCPCSPEAAAMKSFCGLEPGTCSATSPGGYCDPNGNGDYLDGDHNRGHLEWKAKCG